MPQDRETITDGTVLTLYGLPYSDLITVETGARVVGLGTVTFTMANAGTIEAKGGLLTLVGGASGDGTMLVDAGSKLDLAANTTAAAIIDNSTLELGYATYTAPLFTVAAGARVVGLGTITDIVANAGTIESKGGLLFLAGRVSGAGTLLIDAGSKMDLAANTSAAAIIDNGTLELGYATYNAPLFTVAAGARVVGLGTITDTVANVGTIESKGGLLYLAGGVSGAGTLLLDAASKMDLAANTTAAAIIDNGALELGYATYTAPLFTVAASARVVGLGTITDAVANAGTIEANGGLLFLAGGVTASGQLRIDDDSILELASASSQDVTFATGAVGTLHLDDPQHFSGAINGLALGDSLIFGGETVISAALEGSTLTVVSSTGTKTFRVTGPLTGAEATVQTGAGGISIGLSPTSYLAEAPTLTVTAANGEEGAAIPLTISVAQAAADLSPSDLTITISGLQGATLNNGSRSADGSYTLQAADLSGLTVTPGASFTGTLALDIEATDTEPSTNTGASSTKILDVVVLTPANNVPVAENDTITLDAGTSTGNLWQALLSNDGGAGSGDTLSIVSVNTTDTLGSVTFDATTQTLVFTATSGSFDPVGTTTDQFAYTVVDSHGAESTATVTVDVDPDPISLAVSAVTAPTLLSQLDFAPVGYLLNLADLAGLNGQIDVQAYLTQTGTVDSTDRPVASTTISLADLAGATSYDGQIDLPPAAFGSLPFGDYTVVVQATLSLDAFANQLTSSAASAPVLFEPSYTATISTAEQILVAGGTAVLSGTATSTTDGSPVPFASVDVTITKGAFQETLSATTDAFGNFSVDYASLSGSEGVYTASAYNPQLPSQDAAPQTTIDVVGMAIAQEQVSVSATTGVPLDGTITIDNLGDQALTGVTSSIGGLPTGWTFTLNDLPTTLAANSQTVVDYTLTAPNQSDLSTFAVTVAAGDGAQDTSTFEVASHLTGPDLQIDAASLTTTVVSGDQTLLTFTIQNDGQQAADDVRLSLPASLAWLHLASTENLGNIAGGASQTVTLLADPGSDVALGEYKGSIAVQYGADSGANPTESVPFDFKVTTDQTGGLNITLSDEATYLTAAAPQVQGATVTILDAAGNQITSYTNVNNSLQVSDLAVGDYTLRISASNHLTYNQTVAVTADSVDSVNAFLPMQVATYTWGVESTSVTDTYKITLDSTFETDVPVPVVTIDPPILDFSDLAYGQSKVIDVTVKNNGLISVENFKLYLPNPYGYVITPLVDSVPEIGATDVVSIPVTISRLAAPSQLVPQNLDSATTATNVAPDSLTKVSDDKTQALAQTLGADGNTTNGASTASSSMPDGFPVDLTSCPTYGSIAGLGLFSYLCGPDLINRSVPIGYQGDYNQGLPCLPGDSNPVAVVTVTPERQGGTGVSPIGGGSFEFGGGGFVYFPSLVEVLQSIVCAGIAEGVLVNWIEHAKLPKIPFVPRDSLLEKVLDAKIKKFILAIISKNPTSIGPILINYNNPPPAEGGVDKSQPESLLQTLFSSIRSDIVQTVQTVLSGSSDESIGDIFGTVARENLEEISRDYILSQLDQLLKDYQSSKNDSLTNRLDSVVQENSIDYSDIGQVEAALKPYLGDQFSGILDTLNYANVAIEESDFRVYLIGDIRWFDTTDTAGLENFLSFVANAYSAGAYITDPSSVPIPHDINPTLLSSLLIALIEQFIIGVRALLLLRRSLLELRRTSLRSTSSAASFSASRVQSIRQT